MGRKIITKLYEFVMSQPETKPNPTVVPANPDTPPAPSRPGRPIPNREPKPEEAENPMAKVMGRIKKSIMDERGTTLANNLISRLKSIKNLPM
jgi:hypothetical protein